MPRDPPPPRRPPRASSDSPFVGNRDGRLGETCKPQQKAKPSAAARVCLVIAAAFRKSSPGLSSLDVVKRSAERFPGSLVGQLSVLGLREAQRSEEGVMERSWPGVQTAFHLQERSGNRMSDCEVTLCFIFCFFVFFLRAVRKSETITPGPGQLASCSSAQLFPHIAQCFSSFFPCHC